MDIYEEDYCDDCGEMRLCRSMDGGEGRRCLCGECILKSQERAQAAVDAQFDCLRYRLTPKGEQFLAGLQGGMAR